MRTYSFTRPCGHTARGTNKARTMASLCLDCQTGVRATYVWRGTEANGGRYYAVLGGVTLRTAGYDTLGDAHRALAQAACDAWSAELQHVYGEDAGDARYDARGYATPRLGDLRADFMRATALMRGEVQS